MDEFRKVLGLREAPEPSGFNQASWITCSITATLETEPEMTRFHCATVRSGISDVSARGYSLAHRLAHKSSQIVRTLKMSSNMRR